MIDIKKGTQTLEVSVPVNVLSNDLKFSFYSGIPKSPKDKLFSYFWINISFIEDSYLSLSKEQIDKAHKDKKHFKKNFSLEMNFSKNIKNIVQTFSSPSFDVIVDENEAVVDIDDDTDEDSSDDESGSAPINTKSPTSIKSVVENAQKKRRSSMASINVSRRF